MKRLIPLLIVLIAFAIIWSFKRVEAQVPKGHQTWEYATLYLGDASVPQTVWYTGKTTITSTEKALSRDTTVGVNELYHKLGGKEETATLGVLLNHIGQDGWELVTYSRSSDSQHWAFKRPGH